MCSFSSDLSFAEGMTAKELVEIAIKEIESISVAEAKKFFDQGESLFLDVREPDEYDMGAIPHAVNVPRGLLEFRIASIMPDPTAKIVIYCRSGARGALSAQTLQRMGYLNVVNMDGGWSAWQKAGYPGE
jgi:rhodanese-related sulfurtransferase